MDPRRETMPGFAPVFKNDDTGTIKATLTQTRPKSAWFKGQPPNVFEEIVGSDREAMEAHMAKMLEWLEHYDIYYSCQGWVYDLKWKTVKPKNNKQQT